jgi:hypothetical protein
MGGRQHAAERGKVLSAFQLKIAKEKIGATARDAMRQWLGRAHPGRAQGDQPVGFRRKGIAVLCRVGLQESAGASNVDSVAVVYAAAGNRLRVVDPKISPQFSPK